MNKKLKVAILYNEAEPELYVKRDESSSEPTNFVPYFEIEDLTPMEEYDIIARRLRRLGLSAYAFNIKDDIFALMNNLKENEPDVIFNFIEIFNDAPTLEMNIVGLLDLIGIAYTGAPQMALANCQSKILTKRLLRSSGLSTPQFIIQEKLIEKIDHKLNYPVIVKPALEDASAGIRNESIVTNDEELVNRINYVITYFEQPVLIEEFIEGRELNIAVLGDEKPRVLPISEIDFSEMPDHLHNIVSYEAKWEPDNEAYHKTIPICPAILPRGIEKKAKSMALKAFKKMQCRDYARVDMRLSENNKLYILEVNPNPDLTEGAGFMRSMEAAGYSYAEALKKIINLAYKRWKRNKKNGLKSKR
ncbi:MAG: D-alanine--D-alanine ligase [Ignavibacteriales bacterium CG12_big_fil_rev_8_21_14_0_65_30_8]|nr:MAG: D-alanine--D-alanine ligase [Ignavibacteriales bacterium CG12_big_fil_rev_8_21_14_0_65_30_8]